jgi:hypothetical protein
MIAPLSQRGYRDDLRSLYAYGRGLSVLGISHNHRGCPPNVKCAVHPCPGCGHPLVEALLVCARGLCLPPVYTESEIWCILPQAEGC